eukprot:g418.t1
MTAVHLSVIQLLCFTSLLIIISAQDSTSNPRRNSAKASASTSSGVHYDFDEFDNGDIRGSVLAAVSTKTPSSPCPDTSCPPEIERQTEIQIPDSELSSEAQLSETEPPNESPQLTESEAPKEEAQITWSEAPKDEPQVTGSEAPEEAPQVSRSETPKEEAQGTGSEAPEEAPQVSRSETPKEEAQLTESEAPKEEAQVTGSEAPEEAQQATESGTPEDEPLVPCRETPSEEPQVTESEAPSETQLQFPEDYSTTEARLRTAIFKGQVSRASEELGSDRVLSLGAGLTYPSELRPLVEPTEQRNEDPDVVAFKALAKSALRTKEASKLATAVVLSFQPSCECDESFTIEELDDLRSAFEQDFNDRESLREILAADANVDLVEERRKRRLFQTGKSPVTSFVCASCWPRRNCRKMSWC